MENGRSLTKGSYRALRSVLENRYTEAADASGKNRNPVLAFTRHPHQLRHTFCTQCIESGMEIKKVQYLMGHATPEITMQIYAQYRQAFRQQEAAGRTRRAVSYL